jgi:superfamily II DNA/RNA helicase
MSPSLRRSLRDNFNISSFFPIQAECYTAIAEGKDVIGRSKTGTGKTLAFVLPILERLQRERVIAGRGEVSVLVVEPTRELARQVVGEIEKLSSDVKVLAVYGGAAFSPQSEALMRGVDICVGTPGRLMDHLDRGSCSLRKTLVVVLDEADEMLRRGFKEDIDVILSFANKKQKAQMLLFRSAQPPALSPQRSSRSIARLLISAPSLSVPVCLLQRDDA